MSLRDRIRNFVFFAASVSFVALGLGVFLGQSASAQNIMPQPRASNAYDWNGFYVGGSAGYAWGSQNTTSRVVNSAAPQASAEYVVTGGFGGIRAGYNRQVWRNMVLGFEADFSGGNMRGEGIGTGGNLTSVKVQWFSTARARVGYIIGNTMVYATGGFAWTKIQATRFQLPNGFSGAPPVPIGTLETNSAYTSRYTAGGGVEVGIARNWTASVEYLLLPIKFEITTPLSNIVKNVWCNEQILRFGVNYRF